MRIEPVTLNGDRVVMEPLDLDDVGQLCDFGLSEEVWRWTVNKIANESEMRSYVESALSDQKKGTSLPFATKLLDSDKIVGSSRFGNIDIVNRKVEIGWTWVDPSWQRSFVNTEAKLLMLTHAFEVWDCVRVEFKTDALNESSRNAILRLGATEEGTLRNHMITNSGRFRDSVYFSIIIEEWERVKAGLVQKLGRHQ
ncbi:MAG: GNAT family protein [Pyrinomonadaceae bacterium]